MTVYKGHCLCAGVRCEISVGTNEVDICHCSMCRRQGAGPLHFVKWSSKNQFEIVRGSEFVKIYRSSPYAERAFCGNCGTFLYWRKLENGTLTPNAELFDELVEAATLGTEYYYDYKPSYYTYTASKKRLNENFEERENENS